MYHTFYIDTGAYDFITKYEPLQSTSQVFAPAALSEPTHLMRPGAGPEPLGHIGGLVTSGEWKPEEMRRNAGYTGIKIIAAKSGYEFKGRPKCILLMAE